MSRRAATAAACEKLIRPAYDSVVVLVGLVVAVIIVFIGSAIFGAIASGISNGPLVRIVFGAIAATITAPVGALVASVLYFRLREIEAAGGPGTPVPANPTHVPATEPGLTPPPPPPSSSPPPPAG